MDEVLEMFDKTAKRVQKVADETKEATVKQTALYEGLLASPSGISGAKAEGIHRKNSGVRPVRTLEFAAYPALYAADFRVQS